jgi:NADH-quinone oxidoreductase subunit M
MPWVGLAFIVGGLTSMGMPGLSGFVAEFPIFTGMWDASQQITLQAGGLTLSNYYSVIVVIAALGIVITAAYVLRVTGQVFFGDFKADVFPEVGDIAITDRIVLILLGAPLLILGILPGRAASQRTCRTALARDDEQVRPSMMLNGRVRVMFSLMRRQAVIFCGGFGHVNNI